MNEATRTGKRDDLVYDVGMQKGEDSDYYLKKGFSVIGFEADPDLAAHCRRRFSSAIESGKLIVVEGAIAELPPGEITSRTIKFYKNKDSSQWGTVAREWAQRNEVLGTSSETIEVPVVDFAACLEKYGIPHYLKIDIEGMDVLCLRALTQCAQKPDYVSIESEKISFSKLADELTLFAQLGYTGFKAIQQNGVPQQREPNPSKEGCFAGYQFQEGASGLFGKDLPCNWKSHKQVLNEYKFIFLQYKLFGDYGRLRKLVAGRVLRRILATLLRKPVPGWYDTHAKHSSVAD